MNFKDRKNKKAYYIKNKAELTMFFNKINYIVEDIKKVYIDEIYIFGNKYDNLDSDLFNKYNEIAPFYLRISSKELVELNLCINLINELDYNYSESYTFNALNETIENMSFYRFILEVFYSKKLKTCKIKINCFFKYHILDKDSIELLDNKRSENILEQMSYRVTGFKIYLDFIEQNIGKIDIKNHSFRKQIEDINYTRREYLKIAKETLSIPRISKSIEFHVPMTVYKFNEDLEYVENLIRETEEYIHLAMLFYNHKKSLNVPMSV